MTNFKSWSADKEHDQAWDDHFPYLTEDVGDYLNPEGLNEAMPDIRSFARFKVATHGNETKDMEILRTSEAPMENIPLSVASTEMPASKVPSSVEVDAAEHTTTGHVSVETTQYGAAGSEVTLITLISAGND